MLPLRLLALFYPTIMMSLKNGPNYATLLRDDHNYVIFPDEHGTPYLIDLDETNEPSIETMSLMKSDMETIQFTLYSRSNPSQGQRIILDDEESITKSNWNSRLPVRIITHGWKSSGSSDACTVIRDAYLIQNDYNVIVMDWSILANYNYISSAWSVPEVAVHLAKFIDFMQIYGDLDPSNTKIVGHSLGAHVSGLAARFISDIIAEVVGLDPAKPLFNKVKAGQRIDVTDATYVQIIHTHAGIHGLSEAIGTSDFYPNGGSNQPGCNDLMTFGACSHSRAYYYFAESIINETGFEGTCRKKIFEVNSYCNAPAFMGGAILDKNAIGSYTVETASEPPFAKVR